MIILDRSRCSSAYIAGAMRATKGYRRLASPPARRTRARGESVSLPGDAGEETLVLF